VVIESMLQIQDCFFAIFCCDSYLIVARKGPLHASKTMLSSRDYALIVRASVVIPAQTRLFCRLKPHFFIGRKRSSDFKIDEEYLQVSWSWSLPQVLAGWRAMCFVATCKPPLSRVAAGMSRISGEILRIITPEVLPQ
jgi:hypothetical protein